MRFLDGSHLLEQEGDFFEALFVRHLGELGIHIRPLVVFAVGGIFQIHRGHRHFAAVEELEPDLGVFLLIFGGFLKEVANLYVTVLLGLRSIVQILGMGLGFAGEGGLQVLFRACSF